MASASEEGVVLNEYARQERDAAINSGGGPPEESKVELSGSRPTSESARRLGMNLLKLAAGMAFIAVVAVGSSPTFLGAQANSNAPGAASGAAVKPVKKRYLLAKPTAVYSEPNTSSEIVEHVRGGIHVNVTGITGDWLQLRLRNGKTGYIPTEAAE
jgi:uncharacterized protein YgiM (DUF1202 family)